MDFLFASLLRILHSTCAKRWNFAKFYLPGICLGGSQSAVATRFLVVVPYGIGLSLQIEVRKLALNPEFEKVKGP